MRIEAEYVVPLKAAAPDHALAAYLDALVETIDVTVVDGSPADVRAEHRRLFDDRVRLLEPEPWPGRNGKVAGVMAGVRAARHPLVVLADDDVRYTDASLRAVVAALGDADVVAPQNHLVPPVWHARWDTARTLVNRAFGTDYPGTFGLRRDTLLGAGGYDGDVLFENLELIRTVRTAGGTVRHLPALFVERRSPDAAHFLGQRVRQAYDDFAQPGRLAVELALLPVAVLLRRRAALLPVAGVLAAEVGRRRNGGRRVFGPTAALWAPLWLAERAVCVWLALGWRLLGGVPYAGSRLTRAATPRRVLRRRFG